MTDVLLVDVPYDCGHFERRAGRGPSALLWGGVIDALEAHGIGVRREAVRLPDGFHSEWDALVVTQRQIATLVRGAAAAGRRPLILSGNCGPALLGVAGGLDASRLGVVWFDAHADLNTPETSPSGFLDGMGLAMATGRGWPIATERLDLPARLPVAHVVLVGVRDLDPGEERLLVDTPAIVSLGAADVARLPEVVAGLPSAVSHCYLHVDMDVIDPEHLRANGFATPGGLGVDALVSAIAGAASVRPIAAASITSLDPGCDARAVDVGVRVALALASA
jgi:arginase